MPYCAAIIAAGGSSQRMQGKNKLLIDLEGSCALQKSVQVFAENLDIQEIIVAAPEELKEKYQQILAQKNFKKNVTVVTGGQTRQQSIACALKAVSDKCEYLLIHDAARPLLTPDIVCNCITAVIEKKAVITAVKVKDTIKVINKGKVQFTPNREQLYIVQTPQAFSYALYCQAMQKADEKGLNFTDDSQLFEWLHYPVFMIEGNYENIKLTTNDDIFLARTILQSRKDENNF